MATNVLAPPTPPDRYGHSGAVDRPSSVNLSTGQTGTGASTHIADRGDHRGPALLKIVSLIGATPTVTIAIEGSLDGADWYPVAYKDTPIAADSISTFVITTATTTRKTLPANQPWRYLRLTLSANTNVTITADVLV
jgi:hypothetical protein